MCLQAAESAMMAIAAIIPHYVSVQLQAFQMMKPVLHSFLMCLLTRVTHDMRMLKWSSGSPHSTA